MNKIGYSLLLVGFMACKMPPAIKLNPQYETTKTALSNQYQAEGIELMTKSILGSEPKNWLQAQVVNAKISKSMMPQAANNIAKGLFKMVENKQDYVSMQVIFTTRTGPINNSIVFAFPKDSLQ
jgi:hypothetical protein